eukprot:8952118-Pyramimonas_sp.AAC.1
MHCLLFRLPEDGALGSAPAIRSSAAESRNSTTLIEQQRRPRIRWETCAVLLSAALPRAQAHYLVLHA